MDLTEKLNLTPTRRSFIKAAGATVFAAAGAAALGGCSPSSKTSGSSNNANANANNSASSVSEINWDEETDILIVGAGLAGQAAAATIAFEADGTKALLLEKGESELGNGNSQFSAGRVLFTDDEHAEGFRQYMYELRGEMDNTPDAVLDAYAKGIHENRTWIESLPGYEEGFFKPSEHFQKGSGETCYPEYPELEHAYNLGVLYFDSDKYDHVIKFIHDVYKDNDNITQKNNAPLTALVQDPSTKEILGGVYEDGKNQVYVKANKGVIMCCGGFENDPQMRADYISATTARPIAGRCNTGDGHYICSRIGADMWHMNSCAGFWTSFSLIDGDGVTMRSPKQFGITVAPNGRRFFMDWDSDHEHDWEVLDQHPLDINVGSRHGHMQFGGEWPHLPMPKDTWYIVDQAGYDATMAYETAPSFDPSGDGYGYVADTLEELAEKAGINAEELVKTVDLWNQYCEAGEDPAFFRPAKTLTPIKDGPFHACHCSATMLNTDGGPRRNEKGQIIDLDGEVIPNLYSSGEFGSVWCNMYNGGGNLGECLLFSRICVRNILGLA